MGEIRPTHVVSISGGKDSQATAILCTELHSNEEIHFVFADTGNEHEITYQHLDYMEQVFGRPIRRLKADFSADIARKREYVVAHWPGKGVPEETVSTALAALVPTGNPFLDLCIWKGRFPSRKAQFCTQELKRHLLDPLMMELALRDGFDVGDLHSWQGVRRDESENRKNAQDRERTPEGWWIERPIAGWTAQQTVDFVIERGQRLNPLYSKGFRRVGCMPCINAGKDELLAMSRHFPETVERVRKWEIAVAAASKRGASSFFAAPDKDGRGEREGRNIIERIEWSKTSRGGKQYDLLRTAPAEECSSSYGLCETEENHFVLPDQMDLQGSHP